MTLVYPLSNGSMWGDNELRYSLRSFVKFCDIERVIIVGHKPDWIKNVEHYTIHGRYNKPKDIFLKVQEAAMHCDEFVYTNDDHFVLEPVKDLPNYYSEPLKTFNNGGGTFMRYVTNTYKLFPNGLYFDIHVPIKMESDKVLQLKYNEDVVLKSLYANTFNLPGTQMKDLKINIHMRTDRIKEVLQGRKFFSIGDGGLSIDMKRYIESLYPEKSKYEK